MSDTLDTLTDGPEPNDTDDHGPITSRSALELRSVVVSSEGRPDRRTVFPPDCSGVERMSRWLTANDGAFVELGDAR